ncbi:MAG TPA: hypothetical protein VHA56_00035 [Mucilaginibacter sp.]|nr:hypothetical protein [Mucilaginibacter sp.]
MKKKKEKQEIKQDEQNSNKEQEDQKTIINCQQSSGDTDFDEAIDLMLGLKKKPNES